MKKKVYINENKFFSSSIKSKFKMQLNTGSLQKIKIIQRIRGIFLWLDKKQNLLQYQ